MAVERLINTPPDAASLCPGLHEYTAGISFKSEIVCFTEVRLAYKCFPKYSFQCLNITFFMLIYCGHKAIISSNNMFLRS